MAHCYLIMAIFGLGGLMGWILYFLSIKNLCKIYINNNFLLTEIKEEIKLVKKEIIK